MFFPPKTVYRIPLLQRQLDRTCNQDAQPELCNDFLTLFKENPDQHMRLHLNLIFRKKNIPFFHPHHTAPA